MSINLTDLLYLFMALCMIIVGFKIVHGIVKVILKAIGFTILSLVLLKIFAII